MELELMNVFHLYIDDKCIVMRANMTKKQLAEELKQFTEEEPEFKPVMFRHRILNKGYKIYYEQI